MPLKFFYTDYCEGKSVDAPSVWPRQLDGILHSMNCVLHMPDNFCGIVNNRGQTLQFVVEANRTVTADVPIVDAGGKYMGSYAKNTSLAECLQIVRALNDETDFTSIGGLVYEAAQAG
jgi:hypothetical protein